MVDTRSDNGQARGGAPSRRRLALWLAPTLIVAAFVGAGIAISVHSSSAPAPSRTTTSWTPATTTTTVPPTVTLSAVGDTELGNTPGIPSNPRQYLQPIRAALAAPIVFGNLEGTLTNATTSKCATTSSECYAFRVPTTFASVYRAAGFTVLNSANNHSHDFGGEGAIDTSEALSAAGIAQAGLPGQIGVVSDGAVKVAFVGFAPYTNTNDLLNFPAAAQLIAKAKQLANVVVVYMHAGAEGEQADHVTRQTETYVGEDRGNPYAFAHAAINDGADLVIASGPHVLRGMEWYRGRLIAYSLGDFVNFENFSAAGDLDLSAILHVTMSSTGTFVSGRFTSVRLTFGGQPFVDPTDASAVFVNQLSKEDFGADAAIIAANGSIERLAG